MLGTVEQTAADVLDYDVDFGDWLSDGDTLTSASATADPGITIQSVDAQERLAKVWVSGGQLGTVYQVTVLAVTHLTRKKQVCFKVKIVGCK